MDIIDKAYELYETYLKSYKLAKAEPILARVKAKECCIIVCDDRIHELNTYGEGVSPSYTIKFWERVKQEINNI
jgi:hypothetical protein